MTLSEPAPLNITTKSKKNYRKQILALRRALRSQTVVGRALRVLVLILQNPQEPYGSFDVEVLLLLTLAERGQ